MHKIQRYDFPVDEMLLKIVLDPLIDERYSIFINGELARGVILDSLES